MYYRNCWMFMCLNFWAPDRLPIKTSGLGPYSRRIKIIIILYEGKKIAEDQVSFSRRREKVIAMFQYSSVWPSFHLNFSLEISLFWYTNGWIQDYFLLLKILAKKSEDSFSQSRNPQLNKARIYICKPCDMTDSITIYAIVVM